MRQRKKKIINLEDYLDKVGLSKKDLYSLRYKRSLQKARQTSAEKETIEKLKVRTGNYSLRYQILRNPWVKQRPASKALSWLYKTVFTNSRIYKYDRRLMYQGGLFMFQYFNPKYKGTSVLPWFDKFPLVVSLGPKETNQGIRNLGFNLHLLPPKIRIIVLCAIFELYKKIYRFQIFAKRESPVMINYGVIVDKLKRFGVKFCIRMYIPNRQNQIIRFPWKDWCRAIFIPSRGYDGIRAQMLIREWRDFCRASGVTISPNIDWKSQI